MAAAGVCNPKAMAALVAACALFAAALGSSRAATLPTIYVNYTMNCTFTITDDNGRPVTSISPGQYQVLVATPASFGGVDLAGIYDMTACKGSVDFHLTGPGVNLATTLDDGDSDNVLLDGTFQPSATYAATDGNQPTVAHVSFTTTATGPPASPAPAPVPTSTSTTGSSSAGSSSASGGAAGGKTGSASTGGGMTLLATVGGGGRVTLARSGSPVTTLRSGLYVITVNDRSATSGFEVQQLGKAAKAITSAAFTGRRSAVVRLTKGRWLFYPSGAAKRSAFLVTG